MHFTYSLSRLALPVEDLSSLNGPDPKRQRAIEDEV